MCRMGQLLAPIWFPFTVLMLSVVIVVCLLALLASLY